MTRRAVFLPLALTACKPSETLPDFGLLPPFRLTDHRGKTFQNADLQNNVWVMDFIFTRCNSVCPRLTEEMRKTHSRINDRRVKMLSISIDPEYDTPQRLAEYAVKHFADSPRWFFVTGDKAVIRALQVKTQRHIDPEEITAHSKQFYLLDGGGYIRGVYSITLPGRQDEVSSDVKRLLSNSTLP